MPALQEEAMSIRNVAVVCAILALTVGPPSAGAAEGDLPNNFVNVKILFPVNGLEVEHVFPNGIGVAVAGSYLSAKTSGSSNSGSSPAADITARSTSDYAVKYTTFGGGIKKYIGDHRMFYVAGYPHVIGIKVSQEEVGYKEEGSLSAFTFLGAFGWRGILGHFTIGGELGGGYLGLKDITLTGTDPEKGKVSETYNVDIGGFGPTAQFYLGYAF
jgi:hypothetical protein